MRRTLPKGSKKPKGPETPASFLGSNMGVPAMRREDLAPAEALFFEGAKAETALIRRERRTSLLMVVNVWSLCWKADGFVSIAAKFDSIC